MGRMATYASSRANTTLATGGLHANPEARIGYDVRNRHIYLEVRNSGNAACHVIVDNAYGEGRAWRYTLRPGDAVQDHWELNSSRG